MTKCAIVTGAARGIGLVTAKQFLAMGWAVALVDRDREELDRAISPLGAQAAAMPYDISDPDQVATMITDTLAAFGRIDALVNNAIPLNRYGSEDEIANVIVFLRSDKASFVTGQVIAADGGFDSTGVGLPALRV
ncbi:Ribitol 2-dehydrogenase [Thalassovita gelatinovora]|uniref:Ribitol 2-dehydrogenase n=1 Tax=Thalassovita gelatinovora TaxID=53501 RepID=A0A0N7LWB5_THAGE|nr:SDR family oxidoreductase [Thalassovita gelatinovora]QIZ79045.1 SDR family oxidoreductase [Thalassovita gelatinovora]CUH68634.1 Ribitol 2-dehydrogenase [Thalassovita gelatinovora]SEQ55846.1 short chain dehydrogenase [Thalassovita gelatinovora]